MRLPAFAVLGALAFAPAAFAQEEIAFDEPIVEEEIVVEEEETASSDCGPRTLVQALGLERARECASPDADQGLSTAETATSTRGAGIAIERSGGAAEVGLTRAAEARDRSRGNNNSGGNGPGNSGSGNNSGGKGKGPNR